MRERQIRKIFGVSLSLTTVRPVVVHPLTASKIDCVIDIPKPVINGIAEMIIARIQEKTTINPPSFNDKVTSSLLSLILEIIIPNIIAIIAGIKKARKYLISSG